MAKALAEQKTNLPATNEYAEFAGQGFENQTRADFTIPYLTILQGLSPQLQTLEGAKIGMLLNTVSEQLWPGQEGCEFVPVLTQNIWNEWRPNRGGKVAEHAPGSQIVLAAAAKYPFGKLKTEAGNDLTDTFRVFGGIVVDDEFSPAVISFKSMSIKPYKLWMSKIDPVRIRLQAPMRAFRFRMKSIEETHNNQKFFNWSIAWAGGSAEASLNRVSGPVFIAASHLYKSVSEGKVRTAEETQDSGGESIHGNM